MASGLIICSCCGRNFLRDIRHINENIKLGHKFYCSQRCQYSNKTHRIELTCENMDCNNKFKRAPNDISAHNFCSTRCAAIFNNQTRWGVKKPKKLLSTEEKGAKWKKARQKYWVDYWIQHGPDYVVSKIRDFVRINNRVPVKRELYGIYKSARKFFGTWNNAVKTAGFKPNPVLFAHKQVAKDGHICDSMAEKIMDDFLFESGINHERNYPYPDGTYTADFKIGDTLLEYFGLAGEHERYDELKKIKQEIVKKFNLNLIGVYPNDLYSKDGLINIVENLYKS